MTPIQIRRYTDRPCTALDDLPEQFERWAQAAHGWDRPALAKRGLAYGATGTALGDLVAMFERLNTGDGRCCSCCAPDAPHTAYGGLLHYCAEDYRIYAARDLERLLEEDRQTATGTPPRFV